MQGEQIQQHLYAQSVPHIRQIKGLFAGLVVHHPQIELAVLQPAVHPVHLAAHGKSGFSFRHGDGGELPVLAAEAQLKGNGPEIRYRHLVGDVLHDGTGCLPQTGEQIPEPGALPGVAVDLRPGVLVHIVVYQLSQRRLVHLSVTAPVPHVTVHIFQQIVDECTHLRRLKAGAGALLGAQTVLHEVPEMAAFQPVDAGGGHGDVPSVQRLHRLPR